MPITGVLKEIARDLNIQDKIEQAHVYRIWRESVGDAVAQNASPAMICGSVLHVNVTSPVWVQQLRFLRDMLLEKINARLKDSKISDIRFRVGPVSTWARHAASPTLPELAPREEAATQRDAAHIRDPEVREAFQKFMETYLKAHKPQDG